MMLATRDLLSRASAVVQRLRDAGQHDRANRFAGRAEVVITRHAARHGELLPTLYVTTEPGEHAAYPRHVLTTWPGNRIGLLEVTGTARGFHGVKLTCYAITIEGRRYIGRGHGPGMYLNLRPSKRRA